VIEVTESRSEIVHEPLPVDDPAAAPARHLRARDLLGWEPQVELREGLQAHDRAGRHRASRRRDD
jgi:dTDP-glucose 4,6-dehydratase